MNEYLNEEGKVITEEQILASAKKSGITTEEIGRASCRERV